MRKKKNEWLNSYFIALLFSMCFFMVIDIAYDYPIWEFQPIAFWIRLQVVILIIIAFFVAGYYYQRIAHYFIDKNNGKNKANWKEYVFVFLINLIIFNILYLFIIYFITEMGFRWKEFILNNSTVPILMLLYYMMVRNNVLFNSYAEQSLQLEKVKVDQLDTELKFLKSQYHPHFLFNALNTIYFQVDEENTEAKQSIEQLSDLLRYQLYDIEQEVTMEQEINYLRSYISFQQLRMTGCDRLSP